MAEYLLLEEVLADENLDHQDHRREVREQFLQHGPSDREFINTFRLTPELFETLCELIIPLMPPKRSIRGIDPTMKVLTALKFFARGDYQGGVGRDDWIPMSQQTVSRCLREVTQALNDPAIVRQHIRFPQNHAERSKIKAGFFNKYRLPGICGAIDCTHVAIIRPSIDEDRFRNRKQYHSLNVQMICDELHHIINVDASYGGATHDSFIFQHGEIRQHFEELSRNETAILLGDSGYALREYMMTPVDGAEDHTPEGRFNQIQKRARSTIERTFGILKGRWRCLLAARQLHYDPEMAGKIVVACSVLHNMCMASRVEPVELTDDEQQEERRWQPEVPSAAAAAAPPAAVAGHVPRGAAGVVPGPAAEALQRGREAHRSERRAVLVDITVPHGENLVKAEKDKLSKDIDLAHEITATWDVDSTIIVPIVVSANGLVAKSLDIGCADQHSQ